MNSTPFNISMHTQYFHKGIYIKYLSLEIKERDLT